MKRVFSTSYHGSGFKDLFTALVKLYSPQTIVELGTQHGRSAIWLAKAMKQGHLYTYDLFQKRYAYPPHGLTRASLTATKRNIAAANLQDKITIRRKEALLAYKDFDQVDILHCDFGNFYDTVLLILKQWHNKVNKLIILEGGIYNKWQREFNFRPFAKVLDMKFISKDYDHVTINKNAHYAVTLLVRKEKK